MDSAARSQFVGAYTKLLTNAWADEAYMQRLKSDPRPVLAEAGLDVPAGTAIHIHDSEGQGTLEDQVELWEKGLAAHDVTLYVPKVPQVETSELSESELAGVAGGTDYCCCCSPCCTCT